MSVPYYSGSSSYVTFASGNTTTHYMTTDDALLDAGQCKSYLHDYDDGGICNKCGHYDEEYDEDFEDEDEDDPEGLDIVAKSWNGNGTAWVSQKQLNRAKELFIEHGVGDEAAIKIALILEAEFNYPPHHRDVGTTMVIAIRETEELRAIKEAAAKAVVPEPTGGIGLAAVKVQARKGQRRRLPEICMIPDCGCEGTSHP